jgi:alpha-ribazole phosphatase
MDLVLIRHARPEVAQGICYGALDLPLAQPVVPEPARILSALIGLMPQRIVSSTMMRARATAALLAQDLGLVPEAEARLRELDFGSWEGCAWDAVPRAELDAWAADLLHARPHGGESVAEAMARVAAWADALPAHAPDRLWVVAGHHAGVGSRLWSELPVYARRHGTAAALVEPGLVSRVHPTFVWFDSSPG